MSLVRWGVAAALTSAVGGYFAVAQGAAKKKKQQELEMELMLNSYISTDSSAGTAGAAPPAAGADLLADLEPLTGGEAIPPRGASVAAPTAAPAAAPRRAVLPPPPPPPPPKKKSGLGLFSKKGAARGQSAEELCAQGGATGELCRALTLTPNPHPNPRAAPTPSPTRSRSRTRTKASCAASCVR